MNSKEIQIDIGQQFSKYPGGRYYEDGEHNGQSFRTTLLIPALQSGNTVRVLLDTTRGYDSSFLEEAFGGIFRETNLTLAEVNRIMTLESEDEFLLEEIKEYMEDAWREAQA